MRRPGRLALLMALLGAAVVLRLCMGEPAGWPGRGMGAAVRDLAWGAYPSAVSIAYIRLFDIALCIGAGAALACGGVALQALLRNPLAEPFILGLSTGAGVGIYAQLLLYYRFHRSLGANHVGALAGAAATMLIVFTASRRRGTLDPLGLLLIGVVLSTINGAIIMLLNRFAPGGINQELAAWMMGNLNQDITLATLRLTLGVVLLGVVVLFLVGRAMDVATFSDAEAHSLGVSLARLRAVLFVTATVLAACAVVLAGPVAFVGLICPHLGRAFLGPGHRRLLVGSAVLGATLLILSDAASKTIDRFANTGPLPLGIFTAMLGGPAFLWMLRPQLGRGLE